MKLSNLLILMSILSSCAHTNNSKSKQMKISQFEKKLFLDDKVPTFSGNVEVQMLFRENEPSNLSGAEVKFNKNARSAWHTHPKGQVLVVTNGEGIVQQWGEKAKKIKSGDIVWTPPGVKHWHGACSHSSVTHTALQEAKNGSPIKWMEKVSDEQYNEALKIYEN